MNKYLNKIKDLLSRIPFRGKEYFYRKNYNSSMIREHADFYLTVYKKATSLEHIRTNVEIGLSRNLKFGCTIKEIKAKFREPSDHLKNITSLNAEIYLYKMLIGNHKVKCQLHFFEGKLFMYKYVFHYLGNDGINEIINIIQEKYLPDVEIYSKQNIIDPNNNCLNIDEGIDLTISYLSLDSDFFKKITNISRNKEQRLKKRESALYNDIFNRI
jgi:hypothetical protein